jgi:hypothetical protein
VIGVADFMALTAASAGTPGSGPSPAAQPG